MYFYLKDKQQQGPVPASQLVACGVTGDTLVWKAGMVQWMPAKEVPELAAYLVVPPPIPSEEESTEREEKPSAAGGGQASDGIILGSPEEMAKMKQGGGTSPIQGDLPNQHWVLSVIALLLFFPLGIVALICALLVRPNYNRGNWQSAVRASLWAKRCALAAILLSVFSFLFFFGYGFYQGMRDGVESRQERTSGRFEYSEEAYEQVLDCVKEINKKYPQDSGNGLIVKELKVMGDNVMLTMVADENRISIEGLNHYDRDTWKTEILDSFSQVPIYSKLFGLCQKCDLGFGYLIDGDYTGNQCVIKISARELKAYYKQ